MARPKITLLPDTLDLAFYAGDGVNLQLTVTDAANSPLPVDGEILAQIRPTKISSTVSATFAVDLTDASMGVILISLTGAQTTALVQPQLLNVFKGVWDVQWSPEDAEPVTLIQGRVECYADVSR